MILERKAYSYLLKWKNSDPGKALLVDGARQIGKTFLIEQFAQKEFSNYIKVDFLRDEAAPYIAAATDLRDLIERLSLMTGKEIIPGKTLVFFDEIQEAPNLFTLSKYLVQDGRFRLIMSGSLLGIKLKQARSYPVGYVSAVTMHPLDFEEFCGAQNVPQSLLDTLADHFRQKTPLEQTLHERLIRLFRIYVIVGGMPEAVSRYLDTAGDLGAVRDVHADLIASYHRDISKHTGNRALQVEAIFDAIPSQLDKENKRFELRALKEKATFERYANDFAWLLATQAALKANSVTEPRCPLKRTEDPRRFKLYSGDTGMLSARYPLAVSMAVIAGDKSVNYGGVYENAIAQELVAAQVPLRYYRQSKMGEVDFIAETPLRQVVPLEVKSGKTYKRHVALNNLLKSDEFDISEAYVLSEANVSTGEIAGKPVTYLPLYLIPFLARTFATEGLRSDEELSRLGLPVSAFQAPSPDFSEFA